MNTSNPPETTDERTIQTPVCDAAFMLRKCSPEQLDSILSETNKESRDRILHGIELVRQHGNQAFKHGLSHEDTVSLPVVALQFGS